MRNYRGKTPQGVWVYGWHVIRNNDGSARHYIYDSSWDETEIHELDECGKVSLKDLFIEVLPETVGQFVLKENGVDRYEGDVFRVKLNKEKTINMAVVFVNHKYQLACKTEGGFYTLGLDYIGTEDVKHIGDLTDYPSLMED